MSEWESINAWEAGRGTQIMTARWLNRLISNVDWLNAFAAYGASPFRAVRARGTLMDTWATLWQGLYRHHNSTVTMVWSVWRGDEVDFDDDANFTHDSSYMAAAGSPSYIEMRLHNGSTWGTLYEYNSGTLAGTAGNIANQTGTAGLGTLGLAPGSIYAMDVRGRNGGFEVSRMHMDGGCRYQWGDIPIADDGSVHPIGTVQTSGTPLGTPNPAGWNTYRHDLLYLKDVADAPRGVLFGVYDKPGHQGIGNIGSVAYKANIRHRGDVIYYRIGARTNQSDQAPGGWGELYYNDNLIGTVQTSGSSTSYVYSSGTANPGTMSLTKGNWYPLELRTRSEEDYGFKVAVDYVLEYDGEPAGSIDAWRWQHGQPVWGHYGGTAGTARVSDVRGEIGSAKTTVEAGAIQMPCPNLTTGWPTVDANNLHQRRQRTGLLWAGTAGTIYWGATNQALGTASAGSLDLRGLSGLDVGTFYYVAPRGSISYLMEV